MDFLGLYNFLDSSYLSEDEGIGDNRLQCYIGKIYEIRQVTEEKRIFLVKSLELEDTVPNDANLYIRVDDNILDVGKVAYSWITKDGEAIHRTESIYMNSMTRNFLSIGMDVFADDVPCPPTTVEKHFYNEIYEASRSLQLEREANPFQFHPPFWRPDNPEPNDEPNYEDFDFSMNVGSLALYERMERDAFFDVSGPFVSEGSPPASSPVPSPVPLPDSLPVPLPDSFPIYLANSEPEGAMAIEVDEETSDEDDCDPSSSSTPVSSPEGSGAARTNPREPAAVKPVPISLSISFSSLALSRLAPIRSLAPLSLSPPSLSVPSSSSSPAALSVPSTSSSSSTSSLSVPSTSSSESLPSSSSSLPSSSSSRKK